jgi:hypothetical protein
MISASDRIILRELARRVADIAAMPVQAERRALWKKHNVLQPVRPMIMVFPEGSWRELLPQSALRCAGEAARGHEYTLRARLYKHDHIGDDEPTTREWKVAKAFSNTGWGLERKRIESPMQHGAWHFDPVIDSAADLKKLRVPEIALDEPETQRRLTEAQELFGDILDVKRVGVQHLSFHLWSLYTGWRGLEQGMMDMYEEPQMLHDAMAFLERGHHELIRQYRELGLLTLNNDGSYQNSGGISYSDELPAKDFDGTHVRCRDLWASAEAQELAQVGPDQHAEFALAYERRLLEPFGLTGYGCCEDLSRTLNHVCPSPTCAASPSRPLPMWIAALPSWPASTSSRGNRSPRTSSAISTSRTSGNTSATRWKSRKPTAACWR